MSRSTGQAARWALGLLSAAACAASPKVARRASAPPALVLSLTTTGPTADGGAARPIAAGTVALALAGLPVDELRHLRESLTASTDAAVRRAVPLLFDLDDAQAALQTDPLRAALPDLPALTAAANLLGAPWQAPGLSVELGPACQPGATRCAPLFSPSGAGEDSIARRGHALLWSLSHAAILRTPSGERPELLAALRAEQAARSGSVALVFDSPRGALDETELGLLRDQARRALPHLPPKAPQRAWLEALATASARWQLPLPLEPDQILAIPRLGALSRLGDFQADLARAGTFEWVVKPGA